MDATIIDSDKGAVKRTHEGGRGYQPVLVLRAEQNMIVADEFRDGKVSAGGDNHLVVERAVAALFWASRASACPATASST